MITDIVTQIPADASPATTFDYEPFSFSLTISPRYVKSSRRRPPPLAKRIKACKLCQRTAGGTCARHRREVTA